MKNIKSYSDHNMETAKDKISKAIESCTNHRQIEVIYSMIENFKNLYADEDISALYKSLNKKIEEINVD